VIDGEEGDSCGTLSQRVVREVMEADVNSRRSVRRVARSVISG
jgi:hypothetical protein